jgi:D-alanyl-D-alanine carboxypeptidase/D-alanyl-D-alanine-endopeptidase (penicillin-binding protein 4)
LSIHRNQLAVRVTPTIKNQPPLVEPLARPLGYALVNRARTSEAGGAAHWKVGVHQGVFTIAGEIPEHSPPQAVSTEVDDPTTLVLTVFRRVTSNAGIEIKGTNRQGKCPHSLPVIAKVASRPLSDLLGELLRAPGGFLPEMLLHTLGAVVYGPPGTPSKGLNAVAESLKRLGVKTTGNRVHDASGFSADNRLSARLLTDFLTAAAHFPSLQTQLVAELPEAGREEALPDRFQGERLPGVLLATTGRGAGVLNLAGYFWNPEGRVRSFAVLMTGLPASLTEHDAMRLQDEIVLLLMHIP